MTDPPWVVGGVSRPAPDDNLGWYNALRVRQESAAQLDWIESPGGREFPFDPDVFWQSYSSDIAEAEEATPRPAIEELFASQLGKLAEVRALVKWELSDAPDTTLRDAFQRWLATARSTRPLPVKRRGRPGLPNTEVAPDRLDTWRAHRVLDVLDADFYCRVFAKPQLSHAELCNELKPTLPSENTDPKDWGRAARASAEEALACVEMLGHQVRGAN